MGLKLNLPHVFKQVGRSMPQHGAVLEEFERHLRETIRGEHTLQELAQLYCLTDPRPARCPKCNSPSPERHPAVQFEGEVQPCTDDWHIPQS